MRSDSELASGMTITPVKRAAINLEIEQLWNTSPAAIGPHTKAEWNRFMCERKRLFNKLGDGCRYCGWPHPEFYMLHDSDLWRKVVNVQPGRRCYGAGYVCLACVAERLYPRQLYDTDFGPEGRDEDEDGKPLLQDGQWTDPETGTVYGIECKIAFPGTEPEVRVDIGFSVNPGNDPDKWTDEVWDQLFELEFEHVGWLEDYCRMHGLKLIRDGEEVDLVEEIEPATCAAG